MDKSTNPVITENHAGRILKDPPRAEPRTACLPISACMIVRDEEAHLLNCLNSIRNIVSEIIIVDTGSKDNTIQIAENFGASVYVHSWEKNFSYHRNQSISYASSDWIFVIDADEKLVDWDDRIFEKLMEISVDCVSLGVKNIFAQGRGLALHNSIRLFRNNGIIRYQGRVHNQLTGWENPYHSKANIHHIGYVLSEKEELKKFIRTSDLLMSEIALDPLNPKWHHYLAVAYLGRKNYEKALRECEMSLRLLDSGSFNQEISLWTRFVGAIASLNSGLTEEAKRYCLDALRENPLHIDSYYVLSSIYYGFNQFEAFLNSSQRYLELLDQLRQSPSTFGFMVHNTIEHEWRVLLHRGFVFAKNGQIEESQQMFSSAEDKSTDMGEFHKHLCLFHIRNRDFSEALPHLEQALDLYPKDLELIEARNSFPIGYTVKNDASMTPPSTRSVSVKTSPPSISLCMMVKDEEKLLPYCLDSAAAFVDEIVIVDTGSTDNTVEIARSYGAKVYFHPWENHFSKHRNQSIGYATKEWILILDADEKLASGCGELLRKTISDESLDSIYVTVRSTFDEGRGEAANNSVRIFRNNGIIRYEGRVHNRLVGYKKSSLYPITIFHEGYNLSVEQSRKKFLRTTALLKRDIDENPCEPRAYHYLAAAYLSENMYLEARDAASKAIAIADETGAEDFIYLWSRFIVGFSCLKIGDLERSDRVCQEALKKCSLHLDSHFLLTIVKFHRGDWDSSIAHSKAFVQLCERYRSRPGDFGPMVHNTIRHGWQIHIYGSLASRQLGKHQEEEANLRQAEEDCEDPFELYHLLAQLLSKESDYLPAERYLHEALKHAHTSLEIYRTGAQIYRGLGLPDKEKEYLEILTQRGCAEPAILSRLGAICLELKEYEQARRFLEKAFSGDPTNIGVRVNLGIAARRTGQTQVAIDHLENAITQGPGSVEALSNLAYLYYELGQLEMARETFERLLRVDESLIDVHLTLCLIHTQNGNLEMTISGCEKILGLIAMHYDKTIESVEALGEVFLEIGKKLMELGQLAAAFLALDVALLLHKSGQSLLKEFAHQCFSKGSYDSCIKCLEKGFRSGAVEPDTLQLMGKCYEHLGMEEASELCYQQARSLYAIP